MLNPDERLTQRNGIETRPLPKGAILVDMNTGRCYRLNQVGAEIWGLLRRPIALAEICLEVAKTYGQSPDAVEDDVQQLVAHLATEQLVETAS
jgi:hypothetical protein